MHVLLDGGEEVGDDMARTGLNLNRHGHAGREVNHAVVNLHLRLIEAHTGGVDKLLPFGLTRLILST